MGVMLAVLSDIHGNTLALKEVLRDIKQRGIQNIVNLGDSLYGPLDPAGTAEILMEQNILSIKGNQDRSIIENRRLIGINPTMDFVISSLSPDVLDWIENQQTYYEIYDSIFACHGTKSQDNEYMTETVTNSGAVLSTMEELWARTINIDKAMILCGHSHVSRTILLENGKLIVNPGSVGLPAYDDDMPFFHVMEAGSPHARYCIISEDMGSWRTEHVAIAYDWKAAALMARQNKRPDWEKWILTGRA